MIRVSRVWYLSAATALMLFVTGAAQAAVSGTFSGTVKDNAGTPLVGATVTMLADGNPGSDSSASKQYVTDKKGHFMATGLNPGHYAVRVTALGYVQSRSTLDIAPGAKINLDFLLHREDRLVDAQAKDDYQYKVRAARHHTMNVDGKEGDGFEEIVAANSAADTTQPDKKILEHGFLQFYTEGTPSAASLGSPTVGANFALSHTFNQEVQSVFFGQLGQDGRTRRIESLTTVQAGDNHKLDFDLGYAQLPVTVSTLGGHEQSLDQMALRVTDSWKIKGPAILIFGFDYAHFNNGGGNVILPRLGFQFNASPTTRLVAEMTPGSTSDIQQVAAFEGQQIVFADPQQTQVINNHMVADRSRRIQFSVEHMLTKDSSVEATVFYDTVSGHGVGLLAIPADSSIEAATPEVVSQYGTARGTRVVYTRRFGKCVTGSVGYAFGQGQKVSADGITDPAHLFQNDIFQVAVAKVDVDLHTGTTVSTVFRFSPGDVVFAIDPFQGRTTAYDPNINIFVTQQLPNWSVLPGRWEATVTVLNLLDQQTEVENDISKLLIGRSQRTVRGGIAVRF
ncbi:MAG TPA: carboxypeptidase-like regulatory domain-containing protein [Blastocatellia bacterium]|nr:carboxypeptidase-like regulatory domain-containing protein [Blastocatellia bacterium]